MKDTSEKVKLATIKKMKEEENQLVQTVRKQKIDEENVMMAQNKSSTSRL